MLEVALIVGYIKNKDTMVCIVPATYYSTIKISRTLVTEKEVDRING